MYASDDLEISGIPSTVVGTSPLIPVRKRAGVRGPSSPGVVGMLVSGLELMAASTSHKVVDSSPWLRVQVPIVFRNALFTEPTRRSHHPPQCGDLGAMNLHLGALSPYTACSLVEAAMKVLALSEYTFSGMPLLATNLRKAKVKLGKSSDCTSSR
ncbi:unnamed protein product [Meganyctiphanes norvegica]|uniref:Uncharacterized protein n=1 Tax=Meganyctiphanes norvegica TaxID=48144 RepID=A0AAV2RGF4_MEGNR